MATTNGRSNDDDSDRNTSRGEAETPDTVETKADAKVAENENFHVGTTESQTRCSPFCTRVRKVPETASSCTKKETESLQKDVKDLRENTAHLQQQVALLKKQTSYLSTETQELKNAKKELAERLQETEKANEQLMLR